MTICTKYDSVLSASASGRALVVCACDCFLGGRPLRKVGIVELGASTRADVVDSERVNFPQAKSSNALPEIPS